MSIIKFYMKITLSNAIIQPPPHYHCRAKRGWAPLVILQNAGFTEDIRLNKASRDVRPTLEKYHGFPRLAGGGFRISGASQDIWPCP